MVEAMQEQSGQAKQTPLRRYHDLFLVEYLEGTKQKKLRSTVTPNRSGGLSGERGDSTVPYG
jgi:hypothetical protein